MPPLGDSVPPPLSTLHVTACDGLPVPMTVASTIVVCPERKLGMNALTVTLETVGAGLTVIFAVPDRVASCTLTARTVTEVDVATLGAVKTPVALTVPALAVHVTAGLTVPLPVTSACKLRLEPLCTVALAGVTVTLCTLLVGLQLSRPINKINANRFIGVPIRLPIT